ncbi:hypothetical protein [Limisphaera ngatamarikiensis]|nr:hypothetical protein [Limisphaera ngatamarikiensis]
MTPIHKRFRMARTAAVGLSLLLGMATPTARGAQDLFLNAGVLQATYPPEPLPMIDAIRFLNVGTIGLTNLVLPQPIEFQNTVYITNRGRWLGSPGYRLLTFDPTGNPQRRMAAVFHNEGLVNPNAAEVSVDGWLIVQATNIINRGRLEISSFGQLNLTGETVDLRGGELRFMESGLTNITARTYDLHWGFETNPIVGRFNDSPLASPLHVVQVLNGFALARVVLPAGFSSHVQIYALGPSNLLIQAVYVYNGGEIQDAEVRMDYPFSVIRWQGVVTNPVTRTRLTNELYLTEFLTPGNYNFNLTNGTLYRASLNPVGAARPFNFLVSGAPPVIYPFLPTVPPEAFDPTLYTIGTSIVVEATNAGYRTRVIPAVMVPSETQPGSVFSNVMGRFEILASRALDLNAARLSVPSYLRLETTGHFAGSANAQIEAPYSSIRLSSTNGLLEVRHLQLPVVSRIVGDLQAWVGMWTNATADGISLQYKVLMVSNYFLPGAQPMIKDLVLSSPQGQREVRIADRLNVFDSLLIEAERLTITTNPPVSVTLPPFISEPFHIAGELNLVTNRISWAESLPQLRYLTNEGTITISNAATFAGLRRPPYYPTVYQEPYEGFVNRGTVIAQGLEVQSRYLESTGTNTTTAGHLRLIATEALLGSGATNLWGRILAPLGDVELRAGRLWITNHEVRSGRRLILGADEILSDLDTTNNWLVARDGLTLSVRPTRGDLRGSTVTNVAPDYSRNVVIWAGEDRGPTPAGFTNNVALGRLVLDAGFGATFRFQGLGVSNALYVDQLILLNYATNELNNAFTALDIAPNLVIYYADLLVGTNRLAEPVNSSRYNNGRLRWVPAFADGFYGATNVFLGTRVIRINTALALSTELDSDGDGIVNAFDPVPVLVPEDVTVRAHWAQGQGLVLTWPTVPGATNTLWEATSLTAPDWRVVLRTNFAVLPLPPAEPCTTPPCPANLLPGRGAVRLPVEPAQGPRFYRVEVEVPSR